MCLIHNHPTVTISFSALLMILCLRLTQHTTYWRLSKRHKTPITWEPICGPPKNRPGNRCADLRRTSDQNASGPPADRQFLAIWDTHVLFESMYQHCDGRYFHTCVLQQGRFSPHLWFVWYDLGIVSQVHLKIAVLYWYLVWTSVNFNLAWTVASYVYI